MNGNKDLSTPSVEDTTQLANVRATDRDDGALIFVKDVGTGTGGAPFFLDKSSSQTPVDNISIVAPGPNQGEGRWKIAGPVGMVIPSTVFYLQPGQPVAAIANAAMAAGYTTLRMVEGTYYFEERLTVPAGGDVVLEGAGSGRTFIVPTFQDPILDADDPASYLIGAAAIDSGLTTTISAAVPAAALSLGVVDASVLALSPGDWIRAEGTNVGLDMYGHTPRLTITLYELLQVDSVVGNTINLRTPTVQFHGGTAADTAVIRAVTPGRLRCYGFDMANDGQQLAVGILLNSLWRAEVSDVAGAGFSRGTICAQSGSREIHVDMIDRGERNAAVHFQSVVESRVRVQSIDNITALSHPNGIPRGVLTYRNRCTNVLAYDCLLKSSGTGASLWGGVNLRIKGMRIAHCYLAERWGRDPEANTIGMIGCGLDLNCFEVTAFGEYTHGVAIDVLEIEDCWTPGVNGAGLPDPFLSASAIISDVESLSFGEIIVTNRAGRNPGVNNDYMNGLLLFDCFDIHGGTVRTEGVWIGLNLYNFAGGYIRDVICNEAYGVSTSPLAVYLQLANIGYKIRFGRWSIGGIVPIQHAQSVNSITNVTTTLSVDEIVINSYSWEGCKSYRNTSGAVLVQGDVVEMYDSGAGVRAVRTPTTTESRDKVVYMSTLNNNVGSVFSEGWHRAVTVSGAVNIGDRIVAQIGSRTAVVNNAATNWLGIAVEARAGVGPGLIRIMGPTGG